MPTVKVYYKEREDAMKLLPMIPKLKEHVAKALSCEDIQLKVDEISVRLIKTDGNGMLGRVEVEITAHAFAKRVKEQDEICRNVAKFIREQDPSTGEVKAWLILCELGHSW